LTPPHTQRHMHIHPVYLHTHAYTYTQTHLHAAPAGMQWASCMCWVCLRRWAVPTSSRLRHHTWAAGGEGEGGSVDTRLTGVGRGGQGRGWVYWWPCACWYIPKAWAAAVETSTQAARITPASLCLHCTSWRAVVKPTTPIPDVPVPPLLSKRRSPDSFWARFFNSHVAVVGSRTGRQLMLVDADYSVPWLTHQQVRLCVTACGRVNVR
jgi:hypothetical protein